MVEGQKGYPLFEFETLLVELVDHLFLLIRGTISEIRVQNIHFSAMFHLPFCEFSLSVPIIYIHKK